MERGIKGVRFAISILKILLIEDNVRLAENIQKFLKQENYFCDIASDGEDGLYKALVNQYDLIILDINLPKLTGYQVCGALRQKQKDTPILMLTSNATIDNKVDALDLGADDYMTKPFDFDELMARIRALLRRKTSIKQTLVELGHDIKIDLKNRHVFKGASEIMLAPKEFAILELLTLHRGNYLNRTQIIEKLWGDSEDLLFDSDTVEVHIAYLRKKLCKELIVTKKGFGYTIK
jgi:DNA-binding response OmpR family regulator